MHHRRLPISLFHPSGPCSSGRTTRDCVESQNCYVHRLLGDRPPEHGGEEIDCPQKLNMRTVSPQRGWSRNEVVTIVKCTTTETCTSKSGGYDPKPLCVLEGPENHVNINGPFTP